MDLNATIKDLVFNPLLEMQYLMLISTGKITEINELEVFKIIFKIEKSS